MALSNFAFCLLLLCYAFVGSEKKIELVRRISVVLNPYRGFESQKLEAVMPRLISGTGEGQGYPGTMEPGAGQAPTDGMPGDLCLVLAVPHYLLVQLWMVFLSFLYLWPCLGGSVVWIIIPCTNWLRVPFPVSPHTWIEGSILPSQGTYGRQPIDVSLY